MPGIIDTLGLVGVGLLLLAYYMLQKEVWTFDSRPYLQANLAGASLILLTLVFSFNLAAFVIEACWALISINGLRKARAG